METSFPHYAVQLFCYYFLFNGECMQRNCIGLKEALNLNWSQTNLGLDAEYVWVRDMDSPRVEFNLMKREDCFDESALNAYTLEELMSVLPWRLVRGSEFVKTRVEFRGGRWKFLVVYDKKGQLMNEDVDYVTGLAIFYVRLQTLYPGWSWDAEAPQTKKSNNEK